MMKNIPTVDGRQADSLELTPLAFSIPRWLAYFEDNKQNRVALRFPNGVVVSESLRLPLIRSLQRFQIGETGEGKHLKKFASKTNDAQYQECIDLFIKEEQSHARMLAEMIAALDGTLLTWHWTDLVFIALRRMLGLKTELFILLIAEIIGKCFYWQCAHQLEDERMSDAFSLIVLDEIAHLEFHCGFLATRVSGLPQWLRSAVYSIWAGIFYAACLVFVADHGKTLKALDVTPRAFLRDCATNFHRAASRAKLI